MNKIFGIGLSRTGTSSLTKALEILGQKSVHFPRTMAEIDGSQACTDTTIACGFEFLDMMFPDSLFICTYRGREPWLKSCERFFSTEPSDAVKGKVRMALYDRMTFGREAFIDAYAKHHQRVRSYFRGREDLLWLHMGEGWAPLCAFLKVPVPDFPYPHLNASRFGLDGDAANE